jgi:hypothetical protein
MRPRRRGARKARRIAHRPAPFNPPRPFRTIDTARYTYRGDKFSSISNQFRRINSQGAWVRSRRSRFGIPVPNTRGIGTRRAIKANNPRRGRPRRDTRGRFR